MTGSGRSSLLLSRSHPTRTAGCSKLVSKRKVPESEIRPRHYSTQSLIRRLLTRRHTLQRDQCQGPKGSGDRGGREKISLVCAGSGRERLSGRTRQVRDLVTQSMSDVSKFIRLCSLHTTSSAFVLRMINIEWTLPLEQPVALSVSKHLQILPCTVQQVARKVLEGQASKAA